MLVQGDWVVKRHYTMKHYRTALLGTMGSSFEVGQKLRCPYPDRGPEERPLSLLDLGLHLDPVHDNLRHVMEEDNREGVKEVVRVLYPDDPKNAGEDLTMTE